MSGPEGGVDVIVNLGGVDRVGSALLERAVRATVALEGVGSAEISLTLLDDDEIRALNRTYLGRDEPTDVIAFSLGDEDRVLGDVYVGADQAARQAAEEGIALEEELVRLSVHGTLHVLGHDHPAGPGRSGSPMFVRQEALVREILEAEAL